jgi:NADH-quinone oxidoreductase subunit J
MVEKILFIVFAVFTTAGGIATITRKNIIHALLLLVFTFVNIAAIFFLSQAYFLAVVQVLVYAGAIMVLFVFVVMFLNLRRFQEEEQTHRRQRWVTIVLSVLVLVEFIVILTGISFTSVHGGFTPQAIAQAGGNSKALGDTLFTTMLLPFEIASLVLLVAMVGAIILVRKEKATNMGLMSWDEDASKTIESAEEEV